MNSTYKHVSPFQLAFSMKPENNNHNLTKFTAKPKQNNNLCGDVFDS